MCDNGGHSYDAFSLSAFQGSCRHWVLSEATPLGTAELVKVVEDEPR